jgi:tRNA(Arg) A34 adenosine deaminase TadA
MPALSSEVQPPNEVSPVAESTRIQAKTPISHAPTNNANSAERLVETR